MWNRKCNATFRNVNISCVIIMIANDIHLSGNIDQYAHFSVYMTKAQRENCVGSANEYVPCCVQMPIVFFVDVWKSSYFGCSRFSICHLPLFTHTRSYFLSRSLFFVSRSRGMTIRCIFVLCTMRPFHMHMALCTSTEHHRCSAKQLKSTQSQRSAPIDAWHFV